MSVQLRRLFTLAGLVLFGFSLAPAHYHFVHYTSTDSPYRPVYEKFDQQQLVDNILHYYVSEKRPDLLAPNDSFAAIISQIRSAAKAWNSVESSSLRLRYGGVADVNTEQATPGIDVIFDEIPPGLIAMGGPTTRADIISRDGEEFMPISRAVVVLNKDLSRQPSSSDGFFMTLVHEMGHALGLQHTFTSSVMSTGITRATTKASPLGNDDRAGLSLLYPAPGFREGSGVISGRVVLNDHGVNLASVVALSPQGTAVSSLTHPDGTYRIEGIPSGQYFVYVHPLPPPVYGEVSRANLVMPRGPDGEPILALDYFDAQFYPGVKSLDTAVTVPLKRGEEAAGIDFFVNDRGVPPVHSVTTYSFPGNVAVPSAHVSLDAARRFLVAFGFGLSDGTAPVPGLSAQVIGGSAVIPSGGLTPYAPDPRFVQINFEVNPFSGAGSRHLLFNLGDDVYVLPAGLQLSQAAPPSIAGLFEVVDGDGEAVVVVVGQQISERTTILFDGVPAQLLGPGAEGGVIVRPPPAPANHRATVIALNRDGQSSWFLDGVQPPTYDYPEREQGGLTPFPESVASGKEAMVEIRGVNTRFEAGETIVGFGSSDVVVRDYVVVNPTLIRANVAVVPGAPESAISVSTVTGIRGIHQQRVFRTAPGDLFTPSLHSPAYDVESSKPVAYLGKNATLRVSALPAEVGPSQIVFTLNDQPAPVLAVDGERLEFTVPSTVEPGPVVARLSAAGRTASPILLRVALAPPKILSVHSHTGAGIAPESPARPGELVQIRLLLVGAEAEAITPERVSIVVDGLEHGASDVLAFEEEPSLRIVQFHLGTSVSSGEQIPLTVAVDGRPSEPVFITVSE